MQKSTRLKYESSSELLLSVWQMHQECRCREMASLGEKWAGYFTFSEQEEGPIFTPLSSEYGTHRTVKAHIRQWCHIQDSQGQSSDTTLLLKSFKAL